MKKLILIITISILLNLFQNQAMAIESPDITEFGCGESVTERSAISLSGFIFNGAKLKQSGFSTVVGKLVGNDGRTYAGYPKSIPTDPGSALVNFIFIYLPEQSYKCFVAFNKIGEQGPWELVGETRLGEIPECSPGYEYGPLRSLTDLGKVIDGYEKCRIIQWEYEKFDDGFDKYISISMSSNNGNDAGDVQIYCDKKKISGYVWIPYADSFGWSGSAQLRFDSSSAKKVNYLVQKDFDGIVLKDSKSFMSQLVRAKVNFGFKVPTVDGYETVSYYKGNLLEFRSIFARSGCKF